MHVCMHVPVRAGPNWCNYILYKQFDDLMVISQRLKRRVDRDVHDERSLFHVCRERMVKDAFSRY